MFGMFVSMSMRGSAANSTNVESWKMNDMLFEF